MTVDEIKSKYNTEVTLVLLCCRVYLETEQLQALQVFIQQHAIDWGKVYQLSTVHRIRPLVFHELHKVKSFIDEKDLRQFRASRFDLASVAVNRNREANRILAIFQQRNIKVRLYKGLEFAQLAYGDIGMREFSDTDIIIEQKDIPLIISLMEKEGYKMREKDFYNRFPRRFMKRHKDIVFQKKDATGIFLTFEFHYRPIVYFSIPVPDFSELLGEDYLSPGRKFDYKDYFELMIINNGIADYYPNIRSILDITVVARRLNQTDIPNSRFINLWYFLSYNLFNLPDTFSGIYTDKDQRYINDYVLNKIMCRKDTRRILFIRYSYFNIRLNNGLKEKFRQLSKSLHFFLTPNGNDIAAVRLPFFCLYYLTKPFRLFFNLFLSKWR